MLFNNHTVLITGANSGIGHSILKMFIKEGAHVIGTSSTEEGVNNINSYAGKSGVGMILNLIDICSIRNFLKKISHNFYNINILINNAGITRDNLFIRTHESEWKDVININLTSVYYISKTILKNMIKNKYGRIISIGSVIGSIGNVGQTSYAASKSGLIGFTKSLAKEVASRGITVNMISPGFILTNMTKKLTDKQRSEIISKIPVKRFGIPEEIARAVLFLASSDSGYITGETIHINGGIYMS